MTSAWAVSGPSATAPRASMESSPDGVDPVPSLTSVCSTAATAHPHLLHSFVSGLLPFLFKKMKPGAGETAHQLRALTVLGRHVLSLL